MELLQWALYNKADILATFSNTFSWMKTIAFHWSLFLVVYFTKGQHWLIYLLSGEQLTPSHLKQWRPSSLTDICVTWPQYVKWWYVWLNRYGPFEIKSKASIRRNDGLMQERRNSNANALGLRHSCTNTSRVYPAWMSVRVHHNDVIMSTMASKITSLTIVYSSVYSGADKRKHQSSASLAFVGGIHRWPVNSPHKGPVTRKMSPFDDVIMPPIYIAGCLSFRW